MEKAVDSPLQNIHTLNENIHMDEGGAELAVVDSSAVESSSSFGINDNAHEGWESPAQVYINLEIPIFDKINRRV
jgi:hypothetical protein